MSVDKSVLRLEPNEASTLSATVYPSGAQNKNVIWSSGNTSIAEVSANGVITAKANGSVTITVKSAESPDKQAQCTVTVINRNYRALLIGNQYSGALTLYGPYNDADNMEGLINYTNNGYNHNRPFLDIEKLNNASKAQIQAAISATFAGATPDDVSYFYYSGHGKRLGGASYIVATDGDISMDELSDWLSAVPGKIAVIMDSCYSGGFIERSAGETGPALMNQGVINAFKPKVMARSSVSDTPDKFFVLTACSADKLSYSAFLSGNAQNNSFGIFTYLLVRGAGSGTPYKNADTNHDNVISLTEAYSYVNVCRNEATWSGASSGNDIQQYPAANAFPLFAY